MREIALDTETTGLDPLSGHRIVEIGCVEMINHVTTGETFHQYINPEREMPEEAFRIHGLANDFLNDKPVFAEIVEDFVAFVGDSPLIIHNAAFDMGFINAELAALGRDALPDAQAVDTVSMARRKLPGARVSLDALCQRFNIDNAHRELHGALLDAELLAEVYLELIGGRQPGLELAGERTKDRDGGAAHETERVFREARVFPLSDDEAERHEAFLEKLNNPIWNRT